MPKIYRCRFVGRKLGALGIFYPICVNVQADTPEDARRKLYDSYEHLSGLQVDPVDEATV